MSTAAGKRQVSSHISTDVVDELDAIADAVGVSRSILVERACVAWLNQQRRGLKRHDRRRS